MNQPIGTLYPQAPYAFDLLIELLSRYRYTTLDGVENGKYRRVLRMGSTLALVEVTSRGTIDQPALEVALLAQHGEPDHAVILEKLHHVLAIDADRAAFFHMATEQPTLCKVIEPVYGLPSLRTADAFEALAITIIEQQILWTAALKAQRWLMEWGGLRLDFEGQSYFAFPSPGQIAAATVEDLKPLKITFKRMNLLISVAQEIAAGRLNLDDLAHVPTEEAYRYLLQIKGIGHWTAAVALGRAFGGNAYISHNDVALQAAVNWFFFGQEKRASAQTLIETFSPFGEWAGEAASCTLSRWVLERY